MVHNSKLRFSILDAHVLSKDSNLLKIELRFLRLDDKNYDEENGEDKESMEGEEEGEVTTATFKGH